MKNNINNNEAHQGNEYVNNHKSIKIDLPISLVKQLEETFPELNSMTFKKVLFIISLINKGKWNSMTKRYETFYELSIKHLKTYLSLNNKLSPIIKTLLDSNIIAKVGGYTSGVSYQKYRLTTPFNIENRNEEFTTLFLTSEDGAYVSKYIADGYIIKYNSTTKVKKEVITKEEKSEIEELKGVIADMQKQIKELKMENEKLSKSKNKEQLSTATIEEYIQDDSDVVEEEIEIIKEYQPTVIEDNTIVPRPLMDDYYRVINAYNNKKSDYDEEGVIEYAKQYRALNKETLIERLNQVVNYQEFLNRRKNKLKIA